MGIVTGALAATDDEGGEINAGLEWVVGDDGATFAVTGLACTVVTATNRSERWLMARQEAALKAAAYRRSKPLADPKPAASRRARR